MIGLRSYLLRIGSVVVFTTALACVVSLWLVSTHDHASSTAHACAVCTTGHAPAAIGIVVTSIAAPQPLAVRIVARAWNAPNAIAIGIAPSRAPPLA